MLHIQYAKPDFKIKKVAGKDFIFDSLRRKWLQLTPEEWVRQNFTSYLTGVKKYPPALIAQEKTIRLGELKKRFDILVYDQQHQPWMMIECKAPSVSLDASVLQQLLRYHISVPAGFLVITNGLYTYAWSKLKQNLYLLNELPDWDNNQP